MVRNADTVIVLADGQIEEKGTPAELLEKEGWFAEWARAVEEEDDGDDGEEAGGGGRGRRRIVPVYLWKCSFFRSYPDSQHQPSMIKSFSFFCLLGCLLAAPGASAADSLPAPVCKRPKSCWMKCSDSCKRPITGETRCPGPDLEAKARQQLRSAGSCEDAYSSISWGFKELNEHHSFLMPPGKAARYLGDEGSRDAATPTLPVGR